MRRIQTGVDEDGRSTVTAVEELGDPPGPGDVGVATLGQTDGCPPTVERPGSAPFLDLGVPAGSTRWILVRMGPGYEHPDHRTDTVDYDIVLEGQAELVLDRGSVTLLPGDAAVLPGVAHQWRAGPQGCTLSIVHVGLGPLPGADPGQGGR